MADPVGSGSMIWTDHAQAVEELNSWEKHFITQDIGELAQGRAAESIWSMSRAECGKRLREILMGVYSDKPQATRSGAKEWTPAPQVLEGEISTAEMDIVCRVLTNRHRGAVELAPQDWHPPGVELGLQATWEVLFDFFFEAWSTAYTPNEHDMEELAEEARNSVQDNFVLTQDVWAPLLEEGWTHEAILYIILKGFHFMGGPWWLAFNWPKTEPVSRRLAIGRTDGDLDHPGSLEIELRNIEFALLYKWDELIENLVIDPLPRFDPQEAWEGALGTSGSAGAAKTDILAFVQKLRHSRSGE